jgi:hypothetical protein
MGDAGAMEKIVTAVIPSREAADRLANDIMADCRCRMSDISIDARGIAASARESSVMVTVRAMSSEAAFCVSELMRKHGGSSIDARSVKREKRASDDADIGSLWPYSGPDRRAGRAPWDGPDRRRG